MSSPSEKSVGLTNLGLNKWNYIELIIGLMITVKFLRDGWNVNTDFALSYFEMSFGVGVGWFKLSFSLTG